ncbi:MAG: DinB family protein [Gemmatimonadota bacterium]
MRDQLLEAWRTNNRINLLLLEHITDEGLASTLSTRGGRNVARQFGHLHDVRVWHLESRAKDLAEGLGKFGQKGQKTSPTREALIEALTASGTAIEVFLSDVFDGKPRRRGFKKGIFTTLAYLVSHESHHRGNILLTLKQSGHNIDKDVRYSIWAWDQL